MNHLNCRYEDKPGTINQGLCIPIPIEGTHQGAAFGTLSTGLRRAARGLRHHPFAPTAQAKTPLQEALVCPECRMVAVTNPYRWGRSSRHQVYVDQCPGCQGAVVTLLKGKRLTNPTYHFVADFASVGG